MFDREPNPSRASSLRSTPTLHDRHRRRAAHRHPVRHAVELAVSICLACLATALTVAVVWVIAVAGSAPNLGDLKPRAPQAPTTIYAADGSLLGYVKSDVVFDYVAPGQIPNTLKEATVAIEDRRFWQHGAVDYESLIRAGIKDLSSGGHKRQGASTLTMQLVDNMYLPAKYSLHRGLKYKVVQIKLAEQLQRSRSKSWILDTYLNDVPYGTLNGETAQGVGAASEMFFDKPVWKLSLPELATLAGLPQSPTDYNPVTIPAVAVVRRNEVLQAMVRSHYISRQQAIAAERAPLDAHAGLLYVQPTEPYVFDYALSQLIQHYGLKTVESGGLKVYTTIDPGLQQLARNAITASQPGGPVLDDQPAAALASIDPSNGHIVALGSSATYGQTNYDFPVQAHRQPGSAFKVFALMTLIHDYDGDPNQTYYTSKFLPAGWLPHDPTWSVHTAEETYQGTINITKATAVSDNTVFAQLAADLGWDKLDATARAMGITSPLDGNPSEVIGGLRVGVTPLEMADAYATLANGGYHIAPTIIDKVTFPNGSTDTTLGNPGRTQVFDYGEIYAAIQVLKGVITNGTGTAANYGCPAAGKTGTASNLDNAWFVGFTSRLSTAVWVGYPQGNIGMANGFGGVLAAPIWRAFMSNASRGYCGDWSAPTNPFRGTTFLGARSAAAPAATTGASTTSPGSAGNRASKPSQPPSPSRSSRTSPTTRGTGTTGTGNSSPPIRRPGTGGVPIQGASR